MKRVFLLFTFLHALTVQGQDANLRNGFGLNQDYNDYNVRLLDRQIFSFDSSLSSSFRITYQRYLNRTWDFNVGFSNGFILNQTQGDHFIKKSYNLGVDADILFKFANGRILSENSKVAPYFSFGYNFNYLNAYKKAGLAPATFGNEYGVGLKIRIGERSFLNIQTALDQQLSGDFDTHIQYRAGFTQSIGRRKTAPKPDDPKIRDYDQDGIADINDKCPTIAGVFETSGCPEGWVEGLTKGQHDSLMALLETMETEMRTLQALVDSLKKSSPIVQVDNDGKVNETTEVVAVPDKKNPESKDQIDGDAKPSDKTETNVGTTVDGKTGDAASKDVASNNTSSSDASDSEREEFTGNEGDYYDTKSVGQAFYVVAISSKDKALAERIAVLLDKDYPVVKILAQPNGFYRVGIYATRDRAEATDILNYAKQHGVPSGWLSFE